MKPLEKRIWAKTASYRATSSILTMLIVFVLTGKASVSAAAGGIDLVAKVFWYYLHEKFWGSITWGRSRSS